MGSIPRGVGAPPPPGTHSQRGKLMCIKVRMLDDTIAVFHLGHKAFGQTLMEEVARHLNLLEKDYFGLVFVDSTGLQCWLEMEKPILRQMANTRADAKFYLIVKFYTPNPVDLEEEYTRYLFTLQIRRDLCTGELVCSESTAALLIAYLVQSDCGDFSDDDYPDATYLSHIRFVPNQNYEFQDLVRNNHRRLIGMSPGESDLALLEVARRCEFYGVKLHAAKDVEGADASLAAFHGGIKVYHQLHCVSTFSWAKQFYKETIEFYFDARNECKSFWKKCVEQHAFFRCITSETPKKEPKLFSSGSSFRYRGRTHKELIDYVREHHKRREPFTRPLRSATTHRSNYCSTYASGYASDPGTTARSLPALRDTTGTLDARVSRKQRSNRTVSVNGPPPEKTTSDVESGGPYASHGNGRCPRHGARTRLPDPAPSTAPPTENMSLSLPNVLDDLHVVMEEASGDVPPKSASGESFFEHHHGPSVDYDSISHDSYRLSEHEKSLAPPVPPSHRGQPSSSTKTLHTSMDDPRIPGVTSKVSAAVARPALSSFSYQSSDDAYAVLERPRRAIVEPHSRKEFPFNARAPLSAAPPSPHQPTTIDSPKPATIFTSTGAMLLKPRVISASEDDSGLYANVARDDVPPPMLPLSSAAYATLEFSREKPSTSTTSSSGAEPRVLVEVTARPVVVPLATSPPLAATATTTITSTTSTTASSRPLAGKVITKDNIIITPEGVKERMKPVPPPKPRLEGSPSTASQPPIVDGEGRVVGKPRPALISVKSEDNPEIEKFHLFNSSIPYTLTLRKVEAADAYSTSSLGRDGRTASELGSGGRRKSVDIVPRNRLPSPASFSSQDHTIAATTPDQGDLLEYVLRRRSMSQERSALRGGRRNDPRRQTQPVRFDLPPSPSSPPPAVHPLAGSAPYLLQDDGLEDVTSESRSLHEDMERLEATTVSISSFGSAVDKSPDELPPPPPHSVMCDTEDADSKEDLPAPPLSTFKPVDAPGPSTSTKKAPPPPPPPKPASNVVQIRTMLMEREITIRKEESEKRRSTEMKAVAVPTVPATTTFTSISTTHRVGPSAVSSADHKPVTVQSSTVSSGVVMASASKSQMEEPATVSSTKSSPPYIDDSPKSSKGSESIDSVVVPPAPSATLPTMTTRDGLQWTDF